MGEGMAEEEKADEVAHVELAEGWPRLWARLLDSWLNLLLIGAVVGILFPALFQMPAFEGRRGDLLLDVAFLPLALMLDAGIQALFGNTLGKWLVGIRLEQIDGGRPSTVTTLQRNLRLYVQGFILGLPLLNLFGMARANDRLSREGATLWDAALGTRVVDRAGHILRTVFTAGLALTLNIGGTVFGRWAEAMTPQWEKEEIVAALPAMNQGLPDFIDSVTRFDRVTYRPAENILNLEHSFIHRDASPVAADEIVDAAQTRQALLRDYCAANLSFYRERNIPVRYLYRHPDPKVAQDHLFDKPGLCPAG
jgi:uncharacterized RDD family membrane protein YckC